MKALYRACENGNAFMVRTLLDANIDVNRGYSSAKSTPLYIACKNGHGEVVRLLIEANVNINFLNEHDTTDQVFSLLKMENLNFFFVSVKTSFVVAVKNNTEEIVTMLIDAQADVNRGIEVLYLDLSTAVMLHTNYSVA